jgi:selenocysteine-specific elongation factor
MRNVIVGTAGHIDHGKTTLVRALTGVDTDRLAEEKRRGISIDLGFAHLDLGGGLQLGFVDVPGHERFVKNMLAGASGIDLALLVVSAAEGVKPQTREHFDICRLLGINAGVIALTKADLVDAEWLELVHLDVAELVAGSFLEQAPVVPVSAVTGLGLDALKQQLRKAATHAKQKNVDAWFRMPVDRAFTMKGFGAVVTGTVIAGSAAVEDRVDIHPEGLEARIRGIQVHGKPAGRALAGQRTALNLAGVSLEQLHRGQTLSVHGLFQAARRIDARVQLLASSKALKNGAPVHFHAGTAEVEAHVRRLDGTPSLQPGQEALVRIELEHPVLLLPGDRFILRLFSPVITIGGGVVLDLDPPRRSPAFASRAERILAIEKDRVAVLVQESPSGLGIDELIRRTGLSRAVIEQRAVLQDPQPWLLDAAWIKEKQQAAMQTLHAFHQANPLLPGMPKESLRTSVLPAAPIFVFEHVAAQGKRIVFEGELARLASHRVVMKGDESAALGKIEKLFAQAGLTVPGVAEVLAASGIDAARAKTLLQTLLREQKLVRVSPDLVFHAEAVTGLRSLLGARKGQRFGVGEFKDWTGVSRKYAIPLLEYFDRERVTRRDGDNRVIL